MIEETWNHFMATGHVTDYLDYRRENQTKEPDSERERGGQSNGIKHSDDWNGTFRHAHW